MSAPFRLARLPVVTASAHAEPVYNLLVSCAMLHRITLPEAQTVLLNQADEVEPWLLTMVGKLSADELEENQLLFDMLAPAFIPAQPPTEIPHYLAELAETPAVVIQQRVFAQFGQTPPVHDVETYQSALMHTYPHDQFDPALIQTAYTLLQQPDELKQRIVAHLTMLWERGYAAEWRKQGPMLRAIATTLNQRQFPQASIPVLVHTLTGRDIPPDLLAQLGRVQHVVFVPSPHVRLFATRLMSSDTLWVFVATSLITSWALRQGAIRPAEVLARVTPLADQTGLQILDLLAQHGELSSQQLIEYLQLSQSSVSRHLKALGSYIHERRAEGASKRYRINRSHIDWTIATVRRFLEADQISEEPASTTVGPQRNASTVVPEPQRPAGLRRFMDARGGLLAFPNRRRDQLAVLAYLAERFEYERSYTEREVNAIIQAALSPLFDDFVTIRRELYDFQFLGREKDGSRYWRMAVQTPESGSAAE